MSDISKSPLIDTTTTKDSSVSSEEEVAKTSFDEPTDLNKDIENEEIKEEENITKKVTDEIVDTVDKSDLKQTVEVEDVFSKNVSEDISNPTPTIIDSPKQSQSYCVIS